MEDQYLASLIDLYLAGVLSAEERAELCHRLVSSPEAREQFEKHRVQYQIVHPECIAPTVAEALGELEMRSEASQDAPLLLLSSQVVSAKLRAWCFGGAAAFWIAV